MRRALIILFLLIATAVTVSANNEIMCNSDDNNILTGDLVKISVIVKPEQDIDTVAINRMSWNPEILEFVSVEKGDLFGCSLVYFEGNVTSGSYAGFCWACNNPTDEQGVLASFSFRTLRNGSTEISLDDVGVACAGRSLPLNMSNCVIDVGGSHADFQSEDDETEVPIYLIISSIMMISTAIVLFIAKKRG